MNKMVVNCHEMQQLHELLKNDFQSSNVGENLQIKGLVSNQRTQIVCAIVSQKNE